MAETPRQESPLMQRAPLAASDEVALNERPFLGHINLRGDPGDEAFTQAVAQALGVKLPLEPNITTGGDGLTVFWLGPNEWLIQTLPGEDVDQLEALRKAIAGMFAAVIDVGSNYTVIDLTGPRAAALLAQACSIDLHPSVLGPGQCAQTLVAKADALIQTHNGGYALIVRRSFAAYVWIWLHDAAREYR